MDSSTTLNSTYEEGNFAILQKMQASHFWYKGRHRFLLAAVHRHLIRSSSSKALPRCIDLGGGCGGWMSYFSKHKRVSTSELAIADASARALSYASEILKKEVHCFQIDLLNLEWDGRWDVAFLLDVLEHIKDDKNALRQIHKSLTSRGLLFVTTPALGFFWTWNDEIIGHERRYSKRDFAHLADETGFELIECRYFMFFLSPLFFLSRLFGPTKANDLTTDERNALLQKRYKTPNVFLNGLLSVIFQCETFLGKYTQFPWGTSVLAVLRKK